MHSLFETCGLERFKQKKCPPFYFAQFIPCALHFFSFLFILMDSRSCGAKPSFRTCIEFAHFPILIPRPDLRICFTFKTLSVLPFPNCFADKRFGAIRARSRNRIRMHAYKSYNNLKYASPKKYFSVRRNCEKC